MTGSWSQCDAETPELSRVGHLGLALCPSCPRWKRSPSTSRGRLAGRAIARVDIAAFSALKTFDPPLSALDGPLVDDVTRHGKFLDIDVGGLHLVVHLARAGWLRWRDEVPTLPPQPGSKNPLAARRAPRRRQSGLDITEAGTKKSLAIYVVRDPQDVPGIARLGPDPLDRRLHARACSRRSSQAEGRKQLKGVLRHQGTIAGIGNAYSDEILHAARMSPFKPASIARPTTSSRRCTTRSATVLGDAVDAVARAGRAASSRARRSPACGCTAAPASPARSAATPCARSSFADSSLQYCPTCQTGGKPLADRRMSRLLK